MDDFLVRTRRGRDCDMEVWWWTPSLDGTRYNGIEADGKGGGPLVLDLVLVVLAVLAVLDSSR